MILTDHSGVYSLDRALGAVNVFTACSFAKVKISSDQAADNVERNLAGCRREAYVTFSESALRFTQSGRFLDLEYGQV
jgi:hypothetical protein